MLNHKLQKYINLLIKRYPVLEEIQCSIIESYFIMEECYQNQGKLLIAGNGGSAADSDHIVGELMKRFKIPRPLNNELVAKLISIDPQYGKILAENLEYSLPALSLSAHKAFLTAYINDVNETEIYAQQILGFGKAEDVFLGISTSGNSKNIINATTVAKALGIKIIALTGATGGTLSTIANICVKVPSTETYQIQEYHVPIYHCWCLMLEERFFGT